MSADERHIGRNIGRVRELLGVKQEALAFSIGITQQSISILEKNPKVDEEKLRLIAEALQVHPDAIRNFDEKKILAYFENLDQKTGNMISVDGNTLFKRLIEAFESNNRLQAEKQSLYERLLQAEQEKYRSLEKMVNAKN